MRAGKPVVALLLAALWLPSNGLLGADVASGSSTPETVFLPHTARLQSGPARVPQGRLETDSDPLTEQGLLPLPFEIPAVDRTGNLAPVRVPDVCGQILTSVPPELPRTWQFVFRDAAHPRAPSDR